MNSCSAIETTVESALEVVALEHPSDGLMRREADELRRRE
jgi:hypothetical protein